MFREKSNRIVCLSNKSKTRKQFNALLTNATHENKMKTYCVKCSKNTVNLDSKIFKTKNGRLLMQSKCIDCGIKRSKFVKEQEAKSLLNNLGIKTPFSKIPLLNVSF